MYATPLTATGGGWFSFGGGVLALFFQQWILALILIVLALTVLAVVRLRKGEKGLRSLNR